MCVCMCVCMCVHVLIMACRCPWWLGIAGAGVTGSCGCPL
ncbi:rCG62638, partial [Rattus norvegicus]